MDAFGVETLSKRLFVILGITTGALMLVVAVFIVGLLLIKLLWAWTVKDLFPGAVEQGLIASEISWLASFKLALVLAILSFFWGRGSTHRD